MLEGLVPIIIPINWLVENQEKLRLGTERYIAEKTIEIGVDRRGKDGLEITTRRDGVVEPMMPRQNKYNLRRRKLAAINLGLCTESSTHPLWKLEKKNERGSLINNGNPLQSGG